LTCTTLARALLAVVAGAGVPAHLQFHRTPLAHDQAAAPRPLRRAEASIHLTFDAPLVHVMPYFGPFEEKKWAMTFDPKVAIADDDGKQRPGVVFTTTDRGTDTTWILTDYDPGAGLVRYVTVTPGVKAAELHIQGTMKDHRTRVDVTWSVTPLSDEGMQYVTHLMQEFPRQGPHWESAIKAAMAKDSK
jgi:hypothetical protein